MLDAPVFVYRGGEPVTLTVRKEVVQSNSEKPLITVGKETPTKNWVVVLSRLGMAEKTITIAHGRSSNRLDEQLSNGIKPYLKTFLKAGDTEVAIFVPSGNYTNPLPKMTYGIFAQAVHHLIKTIPVEFKITKVVVIVRTDSLVNKALCAMRAVGGSVKANIAAATAAAASASTAATASAKK